MEKAAVVPFEIVPPVDTPEFMWPAYFSCLQWAIGKEEILSSFREGTGVSYAIPKSSIEALIDDATGYKENFIRAFVPWFNDSVWGHIDYIENPEKE